jgi:PD-(D/E)XK nuclease superfamily
MSGWQVPEGLIGNAQLVRVGTTAARSDELACPQFAAAKARPGLRAETPRKPSDVESFPLGLVDEVLDAVEHADMSAASAMVLLRDPSRRRVAHPGLLRWVWHAVQEYLAASAELDRLSDSVLVPVDREWVVQANVPEADGPVTYEIRAWGRRYASADQAFRELRLLRVDTVIGRDREVAEVAAAAFVLATGHLARRSGWKEPFRIRPGQGPDRVRVVEVGCTDGSHGVLFDGTPAEARQAYEQHARPRLRKAVDGGAFRPGGQCVDCKLLSVCPAVPKRTELLGAHDAGKARRSWSVTDGRRYRECPAQEHLRRLKLPVAFDVEYGEAARRGQAVHNWLSERHRQWPQRRCLARDVPHPSDSWSVGRWVVAGEQAELGVRMIGDHAAVCPLRRLDPHARVFVEHMVVVHDPAADVVVMATPDLLYTEGDAWVWREIKTTQRSDGGDLLAGYPQIALGVVLLAQGVLGGTLAGSRVELERLTPRGPIITRFDPTDQDHLDRARAIVTELMVGWHADLRSVPTPGECCRQCAVARWCPEALTDMRGQP